MRLNSRASRERRTEAEPGDRFVEILNAGSMAKELPFGSVERASCSAGALVGLEGVSTQDTEDYVRNLLRDDWRDNFRLRLASCEGRLVRCS